MKPRKFRPLAVLSAVLLLTLASCGEEASSAATSSQEPSSSQKSSSEGGMTSSKGGTSSSTSSPSSSASSSSSSKEKTRLTLYLRDEAFVYDGQPHSLEVTSPNHIPEALVITYTNNDKVDAGVYQVTASISDPTGQYEFESTLTATLTIEAAKIDLDNFVFEDKSVEYDGFAHTITGTGAPDGLEPAYIIRDFNTEAIVQQAIDAGQYTVEARFEYANYISASRFATLTITPTEVDKSGIIFEDLQVKYDGNPHKIVASGTIPSFASIEYSYENLGFPDGYTDPGEYDISARFYSPKNNFEEFYLHATLTIAPEEKIIDDPDFKDAETTFDGNSHAIVVDPAALPEDVSVIYYLLDEEGNQISGDQVTSIAYRYDKVWWSDNGFYSFSFRNAGTYKIQAEFITGSTSVTYLPLQATLKINPYRVAEIPNDIFQFNDASFDYDGEEHSITCAQTYFYIDDLYVDCTVTYENNVATEIGTYNAKATVTSYGGNFVFDNPVLTATLTIGEAPFFTEGLEFQSISSGYMVVGYTGVEETVEIPARYKNKPVTMVGSGLGNNQTVKKLIIGENVIKIDDGAFNAMFNLEELYIPASVTTVGSYILPYISETYGGWGPRQCTVFVAHEEDALPTGWVNTWGVNFRGSIVFGYTGTRGEYSDLSVETHISGNKTLEWADTTKGRVISKIRDVALSECVLPGSIDGVEVIGLAQGAGQYLTKVNKVVLADNYTTIGNWCFAGDQTLFQMTIPASVTNLGNCVFYNDYNLVVYFEASEAPETFAANWSGNFPTSAVHFGYKANVVTSNESFDYRLDDDGEAIIVRTKADTSYKITIPDEIDGHTVTGVDGHALTYKKTHYVKLGANLVYDKIAHEGFYGTTIGYLDSQSGIYQGDRPNVLSSYTYLWSSEVMLRDDGNCAAIFIDEGRYVEGKGFVPALTKYIGNEKDVTLGSSLAGEEIQAIDNTGLLFNGSQTLETLTLSASVDVQPHTYNCPALRSIDASSSCITQFYRRSEGSVNLETFRLPNTTKYVANGLVYGFFKLHLEKDEFGNGYLGNNDNKFLALVDTGWYTDKLEYVEIHDGCVVADIVQFVSYEGLLVIPESLKYSNDETKSFNYGAGIIATKASSLPEAAKNWKANFIFDYVGVHGVTEEGYYYLQTKDGACIYKVDGLKLRESGSDTVIVPAAVDGIDVYSIAGGAFSYDNNFQNVTKVVFSEGIKRFENGFITNVYGLEEIVFPNSAEYIGTFSVSKKPNTYDIDGVQYLGNDENKCLYVYGIESTTTEIVVPDTVVGISGAALADSGLTSVTLPDTLADMPSFRNCKSLVTVNIPAKATAIPNYCFENCSALASIVIPAGVTSIGERAFYGCDALTSVIIPGSVKTIGSYAFFSCDALVSVTFAEGLETIGDSAFEYTPLQEADLPVSLKAIGGRAFSKTKVAYIRENVETMGSYVFSRDTTVYVALSQKPEGYGWDNYWNKDYSGGSATVYWNYGGKGTEGKFGYVLLNGTPVITSYSGTAAEFAFPETIHSSAYVVDAKALAGLEFETLVITGSGIANLTGNFSATNVTVDATLVDDENFVWTITCETLTITANFEGSFRNGDYGNDHFKCTKAIFNGFNSGWAVRIANLEEAVIAEGATELGEYAFYGDNVPNLSKVTLPSTLLTIGKNAFRGTTNLKSIEFPSSLTTIGQSAFRGSGIETYYIPASVTTIGQYGIGFSDVNLGAHKGVFLEASSIPSGFYKSGTKYGFLESSTGHVYLDCDPSMTFVDTEDGYHYYLNNGGTLSLYRYTGEELTDIVIPASVGEKAVTSIEARVFASSEATSLTLPEGLVRIGDYAFSWSKVGSSGDFSITLPSTLTTIGDYAFNCAMISKLYVPETVLNVGYYAFGSSTGYNFPMIYVCHTSYSTRPSGWDEYIGDSYYTKIYYYAETKPTYSYSNYWHWVGETPTNWTNED